MSGGEAADTEYGATRPAPRTKSDAHITVLGRLTGTRRVALASFVIMSDRRACMRSYPFVTYIQTGTTMRRQNGTLQQSDVVDSNQVRFPLFGCLRRFFREAYNK